MTSYFMTSLIIGPAYGPQKQTCEGDLHSKDYGMGLFRTRGITASHA